MPQGRPAAAAAMALPRKAAREMAREAVNTPAHWRAEYSPRERPAA